MIYTGNVGEYLEVETLEETSKKSLSVPLGYLKDDTCKEIIWIQEGSCKLSIDTISHTFKKNDLIFLTQFNMVEVKRMCRLRFLRFNRPFFCIPDHDQEVGCRGILFFGSSEVPIVHLSEKNAERFKDIWELLERELQTRDNFQLGMLQSLLKILLIFATRVYKQTHYKSFDLATIDIIRSFNYLVEGNFREKHRVAEYAALLFKSPKTLSNIFSKLGSKTPSQYIYDRIMTEARRLLRYTESPVAEIGYQLGFTDVQSFSRFFSKHEGSSPIQFRENKSLKKATSHQGKKKSN